MAKSKTAYFCQNCGSQSPKWIGKCPSCSEWNTFVEEIVEKPAQKAESFRHSVNIPQLVHEISITKEPRLSLQNSELDRVLGGGLVQGSLILLGGEPGIGKSTLLLQITIHLKNIRTLYVSGEESAQQIKLRADRLGVINENCYIFSETQLENIFHHIKKIEPEIVIIDSIQTLQTEKIESSPGSVSQIKECTNLLQRYAKESGTPVLLIGHINKDGNIAGPKVLEHIVDTVINFEGDHNHIYRLIRATKNRFGSTAELGIFEMRDNGLKEVRNPSEMLLSHHEEKLSGTAVAANIEGIRPFLIEVQALVSTAAYGTPQRSSTGFDLRRMNMLLAVLEKRAGFRLAVKDVFLNIAGGLRVEDPAIDLAVISAILSSNQDIYIEKDTCFAGEVGLTGEIRPVNRIEQRIGEAEKLGFKQIFISKFNKKELDHSKFSIDIVHVSKVEDVFRGLFG